MMMKKVVSVKMNLRCFKSCMACAVIGTLLSTGRVLLMLGKAQFELQKLVDHYVSAYCYVVIYF
jgi:hypothetical protein